MKSRQHQKSSLPERARRRDALLEEALARPGIREVLNVYGQWQQQDKGQDAYRTATKEAFRINSTNHANIK